MKWVIDRLPVAGNRPEPGPAVVQVYRGKAHRCVIGERRYDFMTRCEREREDVLSVLSVLSRASRV